MAGFCIGDHGCKCGFTSGSGSCGDGDEKRQFFVDFQDSFHLCQRLVRFGNAGCGSFCTVHAGTAAKADDRLAVVVQIHMKSLVHIDGRGICYGFVIDLVGNAVSFQSLLQAFCKAKASDTCVCDDQYVVITSFFQNFRDTSDASDDLRIAVRKYGKCKFKDVLENTAVSFF